MSESEKPAGKQAGRRWVKGQSGNPSGKPKGLRNHVTRLVEGIFEGRAEEVANAVLTKAKKGDMVAARIVMERLCPPRKDRPVSFALPPIEAAADAAKASAAILEATARGDVTPEEVGAITALLERHVKMVEAASFEQRLAEIERRLNHADRPEEAADRSRSEDHPS